MSTLTSCKSAEKATLASVYELVKTAQSLSDRKRAEVASAINTFGRVLHAPLHLIPANQRELRALIHQAQPIAANVSSNRWSNIKGLLLVGVALIDPEIIPTRSKATVLPEWELLLAQSEAAGVKKNLARFSKYCSSKGIPPEGVSQATYDVYFENLDAHGFMRSPRETHQAAGRAWNLARQTVPGWPSVELKVPFLKVNCSLGWDAFPPSFHKDVLAYLSPRLAENFSFGSSSPTFRPATIASKLHQIRQIATAVVESGGDPQSFLSLKDLVAVPTAKAALFVFLERAKGVPTARIYGLAYLLASISQHWGEQHVRETAKLKQFAANLNPKRRGMTAKNKCRLRQFEEPRLLAALLGLPEKMMEEACRVRKPAAEEARMAQLAVAIELLTFAPIRSANLAALELGRTLIRTSDRVGHIVINHTEVKNGVDLEIPLPQTTLRLIDIYMKRFHPILAPAGCTMLFPSFDGSHKRSTVLSGQISRIIKKRTDVVINSHLFRHLAAKIYLSAFPGEYGVIRLLLGHKSLKTTMDTYCDIASLAAFRQFDILIARVRSDMGQIRERRLPLGRK